MGQDDVPFTTAGNDGLGARARCLFKSIREVLKNPTILCRGGGQDDDVAKRALGTHYGRENHHQNAYQREYLAEGWHYSHG